MKRVGRPGLSDVQKDELWRRFAAGETFTAIGRALGKHAGSIFGVVAGHGGIAPPLRCRAAGALTREERETISRGLAAGQSVRAIAHGVGRAPSTISREITRNGGLYAYRAMDADAAAWSRARRPKPCKLALVPRLRTIVATKLAAKWSPAQIAGWLMNTYPDDPTMHVSHETIYRSLFVQARGVLKRELTAHLRTRRRLRRSKCATTKGQTRGQIVGAVSIAERPACIEDRTIPGHWEGDLLSGARNSHIATLVERTSRYVQLVRVSGKDTTTVVSALIRAVQRLPDGLMETLTWDRGLEMAQHARFSVATDVAVYFCDPQSPWQRGTNENTNGLLRQYFPDGTDLLQVTQRQLDAVARALNTRPRKTLQFRTPAAMLEELLH
ncbi:IS30 family transposase [Gemmatimonas sp.]|uniref:IS30 family transposase n=1 Tax=Gemmatimonas sp. TaxID=1962908 RepID=UPI003562312E